MTTDRQARKAALLAASILAMTMASTQAWGQAQGGSDEEAEGSGEIVVTGERANQFGTDTVQSGSFRNAKILDVPLTVAVIPDAVLKSQQAIDLIDAVRNTAGVASSGVGPAAYNNITIRGIAVDTRSSYKLNGTLNILSSTAFPLEDKDRVEVLKGASALYYGFSPPSGIVNFVMKRPTRDLTLSARAFGDSNGGIGGHVDVGDTLGIFGYRVNLVAARVDTGIDFAKGKRYVASGGFDLKPIDGLTITTDVEYFSRRVAEPAVFIIPNAVTAVPNVKLLNPRTNIGGLDWDDNYTKEFNYVGKVSYQFSKDWDITGYYGRSHLTRHRYNPGFQPGSVANAGNTNCANATSAQYLASITPGSPTYGAGCVRWTSTIQTAGYENIGYSVELHGKVTTGPISNSILLGASRSKRSLAGSPATPRTLRSQNFINPIPYADPNQPLGVRPVASTIDDKGLYAFDELRYKDFITLLGGVRASDYKDDGTTNLSTKTPYRVKPVSYSAGFVVKPAAWASVYGTYIEGIEPGIIVDNTNENANEVLPPVASTLYEAGLKLQPRSNLLIQLAYFDIKREGDLSSRINPATGRLRGYNDATKTFRGFEGSISGYVTKDLAINGAISLLKARTFLAEVANSPRKRPNGTPKTSWSLSGEYAVSWFDPNLKVSAGVYHTGSQALDDTNNVIVPGYTTFDLGASYTFEFGDHTVVARVNGQNITSKRYWSTVSNGTLAEALPMTVKFSLAFNY